MPHADLDGGAQVLQGLLRAQQARHLMQGAGQRLAHSRVCCLQQGLVGRLQQWPLLPPGTSEDGWEVKGGGAPQLTGLIPSYLLVGNVYHAPQQACNRPAMYAEQ